MANTFAAFARNLMMCNRTAFARAAAELRPRLAAPGLRLLDVGGSGGEPSLTVARALTNVHVTSTDLAPENKAIGEARARHYGVENVSFQTADACDLSAFESDTFDAATALYVFMFVPDLDQASRELHRVLKPGAPLVGTVWQGPPDKVPDIFKAWVGAASQLREEGVLPPPQPSDANPMILAEQCPDGVLGDALRGAGFADVAAEEFTYELHIPGNDPQHACRKFIEGTPFLGTLLDAGGEALVERAAQMTADRALANGSEQVLLEDADPEWGGVDLADGIATPPRALRFPANTCLWVTARAT